MKRILTLIAIAIMLLSLSACQLIAHDYKDDVLEYALIATDSSDLTILDQYPNLQYVDLRGSTCYEAILDYSASHPDIKVRFSIELGQLLFNQDVSEVTISGSDATFEELKDNLKFFRFLKSVHIDQINISKAQLEELQAAYPQISFTYTVQIGGQAFDASVTEVNLSQCTSADIELALTALEFLPNLNSVDLMSTSGENKLTSSDAYKLMQAYPNLSFHYQYRLFGQTVSTETEKLVYKDVSIGNSGLDQIREALGIMRNCSYISIDNCRIDDEAMDKFRIEFPEKTIVWRVFVDKYSIMTDEEVVLMQDSVNDSEAEPLKYCTNVKYLDMTGCKVRNFSFLSSMPNLECVVLQQTRISDLSVLQNCKNLTWLDLAGCTSLKDVSPLSDVSSLKYLNLSATKVKDLSPLKQVPLERFKCAKCSFSEAELRNFESRHPKCVTTDTGNISGKGWRFNDASQREPFAYYAEMVKIFGYEK